MNSFNLWINDIKREKLIYILLNSLCLLSISINQKKSIKQERQYNQRSTQESMLTFQALDGNTKTKNNRNILNYKGCLFFILSILVLHGFNPDMSISMLINALTHHHLDAKQATASSQHLRGSISIKTPQNRFHSYPTIFHFRSWCMLVMLICDDSVVIVLLPICSTGFLQTS